MTEIEAISKIQWRINTASEIAGRGEDGKAFEDLEMAIQALEEIQEYRAIGTVEEFKALKNIGEWAYSKGYNKAIDEVMMQLEAEVESCEKFIREYDDSIAQKAYYSALCHALTIARDIKMKGGAE